MKGDVNNGSIATALEFPRSTTAAWERTRLRFSAKPATWEAQRKLVTNLETTVATLTAESRSCAKPSRRNKPPLSRVMVQPTLGQQ